LYLHHCECEHHQHKLLREFIDQFVGQTLHLKPTTTTARTTTTAATAAIFSKPLSGLPLRVPTNATEQTPKTHNHVLVALLLLLLFLLLLEAAVALAALGPRPLYRRPQYRCEPAQQSGQLDG
jgi:hypothetical protein